MAEWKWFSRYLTGMDPVRSRIVREVNGTLDGNGRHPAADTRRMSSRPVQSSCSRSAGETAQISEGDHPRVVRGGESYTIPEKRRRPPSKVRKTQTRRRISKAIACLGFCRCRDVRELETSDLFGPPTRRLGSDPFVRGHPVFGETRRRHRQPKRWQARSWPGSGFTSRDKRSLPIVSGATARAAVVS